jgi:carbon storage regulator
MLSLTRKPRQSIRIGDDIVITVQEVIGERVRIGIEAPREVTIYREELYDRLTAEPKPRES